MEKRTFQKNQDLINFRWNIYMNDDFSAQSDTKVMAPAILEIIKLCSSYNIECWLNYGALLGMIREKRLLPWNNDAELTFWHREGVSKDLIRLVDELNRRGYTACYYSNIGAVSVRLKGAVININAVWIEGDNAVRPHETAHKFGYAPFLAILFFWTATLMSAYVGREWHANSSIKSRLKYFLINSLRLIPRLIRKKIILLLTKLSAKAGGVFQKTALPKELYSSLVPCEFYGGNVLVPEKSKELLIYLYGKGWNIPKENWSFYDKANEADTGVEFLEESWDYSKMEVV